MTELVIHIGLHKTGSSSFQRALHDQKTELNKSDVYVPGEQENHSFDLFPLFCDNPRNYLPLKSKYGEGADYDAVIEAIGNRWRRYLRGGVPRLTILSGEDLSMLTKAGFQRIRDFFDPYFDRIRIVVVVRHGQGWACSNAQQTLKGGQVLERLPDRAVLQNIAGKVRNVLSAFRSHEVRLLWFERLLADRNSFLPALGGACGLEMHDSAKLPNLRVNESLSMEAALLLSAVNCERPLGENLHNSQKRHHTDHMPFERIPGQKFTLCREEVSRIDAGWSVDCDFLKQNYPGFYEVRPSFKSAQCAAENKLFGPACISSIRELSGISKITTLDFIQHGQINNDTLAHVGCSIVDRWLNLKRR